MTKLTDTGPDRDEQLVIAAFAAFRTEQRDSFRTPPVEQVYAAARRQQQLHRYRTAIAAAAVFVLVLATGALFTLVGSDQRRPAAGIGDHASATPSASAPPTLTPSPPASGGNHGRTGKPPANSGRVDVLNATIAMPALGNCPAGVLTFSGGTATDSGGCLWRLSGGDLKYRDLDGTDGVEAITSVTGGGRPAVVAIRGTRASELKAMGYVVVAADGEAINWIAANADGSITVGIGDESSGEEQRRTYRWAASAGAFTQVDGPTGFPDPGPSSSDPGPSASPSEGQPPG